MANKETAVAVATSLTSEELNALLQSSGFTPKPSGGARLGLNGQSLVASDTGETFNYNPVKKTPALTVRIVKPLEEYNAFWISDDNAKALGRMDIASTFSKKFYNPDPDRRVWDSDLAYDDIKARNDLVDDYGHPLKASWKGDVLVQIIPASGSLTGEETVYTITLSTTSVIEFKGASKTPDGGVVSDKNFIRKLCEYAQENAAEGVTPTKAVVDALTAYTLGGVVAEIRLPLAEDKVHNRRWTVIVFDPIHIEPVTAGPALEAGDTDDTEPSPF